MTALEPIPLAEIERARETIRGVAVRTPLIRLNVEADAEIWLKLETLQPVNSFKIRGAGNAVLQASDEELAGGVFTASAGNMAQGVAWAARIRGVQATIVVPEHAPRTKLDAIARLGGHAVPVPYDEWWRTLVEGTSPHATGLFVSPVDDARVMAGNGTIGLELLEDQPELDAVVVPYGGGGLATGIGSAVKALKPEARLIVVEPETGAPVNATFAAHGEPTPVDYVPSWIDGSGSRALLPNVWARASGLIDGAAVASSEETAAAVRLLAERARVVAEGAGALALAATLAGRAGKGKIACVVSGGNIDSAVLARILNGEAP